jgi:hypothetical protein
MSGFNPLDSLQRYRNMHKTSGGTQSPSPHPHHSSSPSQSKNRVTHGHTIPNSASINELRDYTKNLTLRQQHASPRLAMSQRRHNQTMEMRLELETEVERLKKLVVELKSKNKILEKEKEEMAAKMSAQKQKSDDTIASLRNTLAARGIKTVSNKTPQARRQEAPTFFEEIGHYRDYVSNTGNGGANSGYNEDYTEIDEDRLASFQGPTFAELMRISTVDQQGDGRDIFTNNLRKHKKIDWSDKIDNMMSQWQNRVDDRLKQPTYDTFDAKVEPVYGSPVSGRSPDGKSTSRSRPGDMTAHELTTVDGNNAQNGGRNNDNHGQSKYEPEALPVIEIDLTGSQ